MSDKPPAGPRHDPELAEALSKLSEGLKEGEDPFFYDWRAKPKPPAISSGGVDEAKAYVPPTTVPPSVAHKTLEMQRVQIAAHVDPRRAPTQPRIGQGAPPPNEPFLPAVSPSPGAVSFNETTPPATNIAAALHDAVAASSVPATPPPRARLGPRDTPYTATPTPAVEAVMTGALPDAPPSSPSTPPPPDSGDVAIEMPVAAWGPTPSGADAGTSSTPPRAVATDVPASLPPRRTGTRIVVAAGLAALFGALLLALTLRQRPLPTAPATEPVLSNVPLPLQATVTATMTPEATSSTSATEPQPQPLLGGVASSEASSQPRPAKVRTTATPPAPAPAPPPPTAPRPAPAGKPTPTPIFE